MLWRRLLVLLLIALSGAGATAAAPGAVVIGLDGPIGAASAAYVVRSLHAAAERGAAAAVLRIDTPGGLDSAMREIMRAILASPVPVLAFVAPSGARAASAGHLHPLCRARWRRWRRAPISARRRRFRCSRRRRCPGPKAQDSRRSPTRR